jgi:hypothetical protein
LCFINEFQKRISVFRSVDVQDRFTVYLLVKMEVLDASKVAVKSDDLQQLSLGRQFNTGGARKSADRCIRRRVLVLWEQFPHGLPGSQYAYTLQVHTGR